MPHVRNDDVTKLLDMTMNIHDNIKDKIYANSDFQKTFVSFVSLLLCVKKPHAPWENKKERHLEGAALQIHSPLFTTSMICTG